jgi:hypothetical protein
MLGWSVISHHGKMNMPRVARLGYFHKLIFIRLLLNIEGPEVLTLLLHRSQDVLLSKVLVIRYETQLHDSGRRARLKLFES